MNEIDQIKKIKNDYADLTLLNEAETRFKIIDEILPDAETISGYKEELRRVFPYAKNHNYQNYWLKK